MKISKRPYRRFQPDQKKIEELEKNNSRFKRVYSEYETISDELWYFENAEKENICDDFLLAMQEQSTCLENEIVEWLSDDKNEKKK